MKDGKLYNMIFPIWLFMFFPPIIIITLAGNFLIDSLVLVAGFFLFKAGEGLTGFLDFYKKTILKVWVFGLLADIIGAALLFACVILQDLIGLSDAVIQGINLDPFSNVLALILVLVAMTISSLCILFFNHRFTFGKLIKDELVRWQMSIFIAIVTIPWTFLLPTKWFI
jgi:hypothetical protein